MCHTFCTLQEGGQDLVDGLSGHTNHERGPHGLAGLMLGGLFLFIVLFPSVVSSTLGARSHVLKAICMPWTSLRVREFESLRVTNG